MERAKLPPLVNPSGSRPESGVSNGCETETGHNRKRNKNTTIHQTSGNPAAVERAEPLANPSGSWPESGVNNGYENGTDGIQWTEVHHKRTNSRKHTESFFWSRLSNNFDILSASEFLINASLLNHGEFDITRLANGKQNTTYVPYKIDVTTSAKDKVIDFKNWPSGSYLRPFYDNTKKRDRKEFAGSGARFFRINDNRH